MQPLTERFQTILREYELVPASGHVLVACSGGLDSVVLLFLFRESANALGIRVTAAHFDHAMREASAADAAWVSGLCRAWNIPLQIGRAEQSLRSEADARAARYAFLETAADACAADCIATAHHADDQAETVLFRLLRGTGVDGLSGIPVRRGRIIRPLLGFTRAQLLEYARTHQLEWREDPTNRSQAYARNRIRNQLLPALEAQWPAAREALVRVARDAARSRSSWALLLEHVEQSVITAQDVDMIELARPELLKYHLDIRARLLRRWLARLGSRPGRSGTAVLEAFISAGESGSGIHVKGGLRVERTFDTVRLVRKHALPVEQTVWIGAPLAGTARASIGGVRYEVRWSLGNGESDAQSVAIDPGAVAFPLLLRSWRPGDRIRLPYGSKKLKKLFLERRLDRTTRSRLPVLAESNGNVLWVAGVERSTLARPLTGHPALCITVRDGEPD
jgi:tRNA(Ile)-lysidine synthase